WVFAILLYSIACIKIKRLTELTPELQDKIHGVVPCLLNESTFLGVHAHFRGVHIGAHKLSMQRKKRAHAFAWLKKNLFTHIVDMFRGNNLLIKIHLILIQYPSINMVEDDSFPSTQLVVVFRYGWIHYITNIERRMLILASLMNSSTGINLVKSRAGLVRATTILLDVLLSLL
ncbi:hypothetical protein ACJX0J_035158, partial [Zea mays]